MIVIGLILGGILVVLIFMAYELSQIAKALEWLAEQGAEDCECEDCEESHA